MNKLYTGFLSVLLLFFVSCTGTSRLATPQNTGTTAAAVLQADRAFSQMSFDKGLITAYVAYAAENAVLLRPASQPIVGRDNVRMYLTKNSPENSRLTWSPVFADVAASGEMAYSYGTYLLEMPDINGKMTNTEGTYVSVWKKDERGFWKYVLSTGNTGLRP